MAPAPAAQPISAVRLRQRLRWECGRAGGVKAWAAFHRCSWQHTYAVLSGSQAPGPKVLKALGMQLAEERYEPIPNTAALEDCP